MKAISLGMAAGSAAAAIGSMAMQGSFKRSAKKMAKKAINSFSGIVDNMQGLM
jgi:hypothetical protein